MHFKKGKWIIKFDFHSKLKSGVTYEKGEKRAFEVVSS